MCMTKLITVLLIIFTIGFMLPEQHQIPVKGVTSKDWNPESFWYYPWGRSGTHKGIDIFAKEGTQVVASTSGLVLFTGNISMGGNVVYMIGPKWRFHYFAHLRESKISKFSLVNAGEVIGLVGSSGNAKGKPPHLHYSIKSLFPYLWKYDSNAKNSWKRMFFIDPGKFILSDKENLK